MRSNISSILLICVPGRRKEGWERGRDRGDACARKGGCAQSPRARPLNNMACKDVFDSPEKI